MIYNSSFRRTPARNTRRAPRLHHGLAASGRAGGEGEAPKKTFNDDATSNLGEGLSEASVFAEGGGRGQGGRRG